MKGNGEKKTMDSFSWHDDEAELLQTFFTIFCLSRETLAFKYILCISQRFLKGCAIGVFEFSQTHQLLCQLTDLKKQTTNLSVLYLYFINMSVFECREKFSTVEQPPVVFASRAPTQKNESSDPDNSHSAGQS